MAKRGDYKGQETKNAPATEPKKKRDWHALITDDAKRDGAENDNIVGNLEFFGGTYTNSKKETKPYLLANGYLGGDIKMPIKINFMPRVEHLCKALIAAGLFEDAAANKPAANKPAAKKPAAAKTKAPVAPTAEDDDEE